MPNDPVITIVDVMATLRRVRSAIETAWAKRLDPHSIYVAVKADLDTLEGAINHLRPFSPGVGEMFDTFRSLWGMCIDLYDMTEAAKAGANVQGVHPAVPSANPEQNLHGGMAPGSGISVIDD